MSGSIRLISHNRVSTVYSSAGSTLNPSTERKRAAQVRIIDTVHISDAALNKFRQSKAEDSAGKILEKSPSRIQGRNLKESLRVLEIDSTDATREEIKRAFIQSIKRFHPDQYAASNSETRELAEEKTRQIIEAYRNIGKKI